MSSNALQSAASRLSLKLESAPAFGSGAMPADQERAFVMLAHLFPLIIWFWKRGESPAVDAHGREALNFGITAMICIWPVSLMAGFLPSIITVIISLGLAVISFGVLALVIFGMIQARNGQLLRYPVNFRLIKQPGRIRMAGCASPMASKGVATQPLPWRQPNRSDVWAARWREQPSLWSGISPQAPRLPMTIAWLACRSSKSLVRISQLLEFHPCWSRSSRNSDGGDALVISRQSRARVQAT